MRLHQIELLHILVPYLREIYLSGKKRELVQQNLSPWRTKTDLAFKTALFGENRQFGQRVKNRKAF